MMRQPFPPLTLEPRHSSNQEAAHTHTHNILTVNVLTLPVPTISKVPVPSSHLFHVCFQIFLTFLLGPIASIQSSRNNEESQTLQATFLAEMLFDYGSESGSLFSRKL